MSIASPDPADPQYAHWRRNARLMPPINFLCSLGFGVAFPFLPLMVRELGVTEHLETWLGVMMVMFYTVGFVFSPLWGGIADHFGRKLMFLRASLGMGLSCWLLPLSGSPVYFVAAFMVLGVFNGFQPAGNALIVATTPRHRLGSVLSLALTGSLLGRTISPAIGAGLAAALPFVRQLFWLSGAVFLTGGLITLIWVRETPNVAEGRWRPNLVRDLRVLWRVPELRVLFFLSFACMAVYNGNVTVLSIFMLELLGSGAPDWGLSEEAWIGLLATGFSVCNAVALPVWGRIMDRFNPSRILLLGLIASLVALLPIPVVTSPLQLVLVRAVYGLLAAAIPPLLVRLIKDYAPVGMDARALSWATSFQWAGEGLAPFVAGVVGPLLGLRFYFGLNIALAAVSLLVWLRSGLHAQPTP